MSAVASPAPPRAHAAPPDPPRSSAARTAVITGVSLLVLSALAGFGALYAVQARVTDGDAARTAADAASHVTLLRLGVAVLFVVIALDVVVAWGLHRVFRPVNEAVAWLAAALRLLFAGVFIVATGELLGVLRLLVDGPHTAAFTDEQRAAEVLLRFQAFDDVWQAGLFLFGLHLAAVGYLVYRSGFAPRLIGVLLGVAGLGYVVDALVRVLVADTQPAVSSATFIGEFLLALWLVIGGRRLADPATTASAAVAR